VKSCLQDQKSVIGAVRDLVLHVNVGLPNLILLVVPAVIVDIPDLCCSNDSLLFP